LGGGGEVGQVTAIVRELARSGPGHCNWKGVGEVTVFMRDLARSEAGHNNRAGVG
jgi:hypothetical protein